jgi:hypothetical protein
MTDDPIEQRRKRIREQICEIARRPKQIQIEEIQRVVNQLKTFHSVSQRKARHGFLITIDTKRFMINAHNPGDTHLKLYSVKDFIIAMTELGWYEEE